MTGTKTIKSPTEMLERESTKRCFAKLSARIVNGCSSLTNDDFRHLDIASGRTISLPHSFSSPGKVRIGTNVKCLHNTPEDVGI